MFTIYNHAQTYTKQHKKARKRGINMTDFLTVSQVADELKVSSGTIRQYIQTGKLKASKPGGKKFIILKAELLRFVNKATYKPLATL